jgi:phage shock protein A
MNTANTFTRAETSALVNTDDAAYRAAKLRSKKENEYQQLIQKVEKLETCVENLKLRIEEIESNGD